MNRVLAAKIVAYMLFIIFSIIALAPILHQQSETLKQDVLCVKAMCILDNNVESCEQLTKQVGHITIIHTPDGSVLRVKLTHKQCNM